MKLSSHLDTEPFRIYNTAANTVIRTTSLSYLFNFLLSAKQKEALPVKLSVGGDGAKYIDGKGV
jgi:hypothetical protein